MKTLTTLILIFLTVFGINTLSAQWVYQGNPMGSSIYDTYFLNSSSGWACGTNGMIKTTDGGTNWIAYNSPEVSTLFNIYFLDANTGFLSSFNFFKTTNGGTNWTNMNIGIGNYSGIFFINNLTGWVSSSSNGIHKTTDGGNNWVKVQAAGGWKSIHFVDVNTGWACGANGAIIKTTNGGNNWVTQTSPTNEILNSIYFSNASTGRAVGQSATYLSTTNGGTNWVSIAAPVEHFYDLYFINSSTGWLASGGGVHLTTDNGSSWIDQYYITPCRSISYISPSTIYAASSNMYKNVTGGFHLPAPSLTLTPVSTSQINLSWTDNSDEEKFMIERSTNGSSWTIIDSVNADVTTYQSTGLAYNTDYHYRVYAKRIIWGSYSNTANDRPLLASPTHSSPANNSFAAVPSLSWSSVSGAIVYHLQVATDTSFSNIVYSHSDIGYNSQTFSQGTLQNSTQYYWRTKVTNFGNESAYSPFWSFSVQDSNYGHNNQTADNLYYFANSTNGANLSPSKPTYNWRDTTGSIDLIVNQSGSPTAGNLDNGYFLINNIFGGSNKTRFFGTDYSNVYIGTNGIIAFSSYTPTSFNAYALTDAGIPQVDIPTAIFPFWTNLFFQTPGIGSRLCYKVTSDELIITYTKAQAYTPAQTLDNNFYISFQVVIHHSASNAANSKIEIEYNYNESGSDLFNRIANNTMPRHLIGMQGSNSASQVVNYRFENSSYQYPYYGPIFGSNLALVFGPDANSLPVELASFTSSVNGSNAKLEWATVNELNNSGFDIERKISGSNEWKKISFVQGSGTTNQAQNYSYEDKNLSSGKYQYRLKQIDFNGNYEYFNLSNEIEIGVPKKFALSQNYPNPFNPATKINFELPRSSKVKLSVFDITGKLVSEIFNGEKAAGYYTVEFNGANLASGMYFYQIQTEDFSAVKKMILVK